jgi:hypothetical protein
VFDRILSVKGEKEMKKLVLLSLVIMAVLAFSVSDASAYRVLQGNYQWIDVGNHAGGIGPLPNIGDLEAGNTNIPYNTSSTLGDGSLTVGNKRIGWSNIGAYNDRWGQVNVDLGAVVADIDKVTIVYDNSPTLYTGEWGMNKFRVQTSVDGVTWADFYQELAYSSNSGQFYTRTANTFGGNDLVNARYLVFAMSKDHGEGLLMSEMVIEAIPEPATMMLLGLGAFGLIRRRS